MNVYDCSVCVDTSVTCVNYIASTAKLTLFEMYLL